MTDRTYDFKGRTVVYPEEMEACCIPVLLGEYTVPPLPDEPTGPLHVLDCGAGVGAGGGGGGGGVDESSMRQALRTTSGDLVMTRTIAEWRRYIEDHTPRDGDIVADAHHKMSEAFLALATEVVDELEALRAEREKAAR